MIARLCDWLARRWGTLWYTRGDADLLLQQWKERDARMQEQLMWVRSQLMNLRVAQAEAPRRGWEVMAYVPQEVADRLNTSTPVERSQFLEGIADVLMDRALKGLTHVNSQGRVNALVFAPVEVSNKPKAPAWLQVVFEKDGKFKTSEKLKNLLAESEETRVRRAAGCCGSNRRGIENGKD